MECQYLIGSFAFVCFTNHFDFEMVTYTDQTAFESAKKSKVSTKLSIFVRSYNQIVYFGFIEIP